MSNQSQVKSNPFPGLRPFTQEEDYLFFGREEQTLELLSRLAENRFLAVVGTSGSGKSSLVRCGLLSELLGGKMRQAGAAWEIAVTHPGGNPLALLANSLLEADLYDADEEHARENLLATLSRSHFGLVEAIKQSDIGDDTNFLLVVDQFEEIFRFHEAGQTQREMASEFVSLLLESVSQTSVPIYVVLTMRSDFIGECGQFEGLAEMVNRGEFLIPRLSREQYKRVIEGPIKVAGGQITPRLLQRLLNDLGQQAEQLPCLQHALMRTWNVWSEKGGANAIDLDDYQRVGKMNQALSLHADEIYYSLATDNDRQLCRRMFQALTVQESENRGIRRPQRVGKLCQVLDIQTEDLLPVINAYRQRGVTFLMPAPEVELTEQTIIDISHESLMRVWTRLRQWVDEEAQAAGIYRRLSESASLHEQGEAGLYRDPELGIALAWREEQRPNQAWAERYRPGFESAMAFLESSEQAKIAESEAREAARRRELAQARELAEMRRRSARRLRWMVSGLAVIALLAVIATINAVRAQRIADKAKVAAVASEASALENARRASVEAERAQAQEAAAKRAEEDATAARQAAEAATDAFERQLYLSDMTLADHSYEEGNVRRVTRMLLDHVPPVDAPGDPRGFEWFHLWAGAHRVAKTFEPDRGRGTQVQNRFGLPVLAVAVSPDGRRGAASYRDGIAVFDTANHKVLNVLSPGGLIRRNAHTSLAFSADGKQLQAVTEEGDIQGWNLENFSQLGRTSTPTILHGVSFAGSEPLVASGGEDGRLYFWETDPWQAIDPSDSLGLTIRCLAFSPDGRRLLVGGEPNAGEDATSAPLLLWDVARRETIADAAGLQTRVNAVAWSPDGESIATACEDGSVHIVDVDLQPVATLTANGPVQTIAFSPDSQLLTFGTSRDNTIRIIATDTWESVTELMGRSGTIAAIAFVGDSNTMLAGGEDGQLQVWDVARAMSDPVETVRDEALRRLLQRSDYAWVGNNGKMIFAWSMDSRIDRYDLSQRQLLQPVDGGTAYSLVQLSDDGHFLAAVTTDRQMMAWKIDTGELMAESSLPATGDIRDLTVSRDGSRVCWVLGTGDLDGSSELTAGVLDTQTENQIQFDYGTWGRAQQLSPAGNRLFARESLNVNVYDVSDLSAIVSGSPPSSYRLSDCNIPHTIIFSPDGQVSASLASPMVGGRIINASKGVQLHDREGNPLHNLTGHSGQVNCGTFSPLGRRFVSGGQDGTIRVWDVGNGDLLLTLRGHSGPVDDVVFANEGSTLISLSRSEGRARIWHAPAKEALESNLTYWTELAQHLIATGDPAGARNAYGEAARLAPESIRFSRLRGDLAVGVGLHQAAVPDYLRVVALGGADSELAEEVSVLAGLQSVVANTQDQLLTWRFTLEAPGPAWNEADFDASDWSVGRSPFGDSPQDQTPWHSSDIWLRLEFELEEVPKLPWVARAWCDDDAEFYLNGVLGAERGWVGQRYQQFSLSPAAIKTLRPERNVLAIHCRDSGGVTARIDAGLFVRRGERTWAERLSTALASAPDNIYLLHQRMEAYRRLGEREQATADARRLIALLKDVVDAEMASPEFTSSKHAGLLAQAVLRAGAAEKLDWQVLSPVEMQSSKGATLSKLPDESILASGPNNNGDTYMIVAPTSVSQIGAIRLEALTHESLPGGGPGRATPKAPGVFSMIRWDVQSFSPGQPSTIGTIHTDEAWADHTMNPDDDVNGGHWNITYGAGKPHVAVFRVDPPVPHPDGNQLRFVMHFNRPEAWPGQNLGRFRLAISPDMAAYELEKAMRTIELSGGGWRDLASAYYLVGDQDALDKLLASRPEGAAGIGDLFAEQGQWALAVESYSRAIEHGQPDARLLLQRSKAYQQLGQQALAEADLQRAVAIEGDPLRVFNNLRAEREWRNAARFGWRLLEEDPADSLIWLRLAPTLVLAGDQQGYAKLCEHILDQQAPKTDSRESGRATKACLLLSDVIDPAEIPVQAMQEALDQDEGATAWRIWAWAARGLLAYRTGDAAKALQFADNALAEGDLSQVQRSLVLAVRVLALNQLGNFVEADADAVTASEIVDAQLQSAGIGSIHDVLIPQILLSESQGLFESRRRQLAEWADNEQWTLIAQHYLVQLGSLEDSRAAYRPRCQLLQQVLLRNDGVYDAMLELQPENTLLYLARARDLALRKQWATAADGFTEAVVDTPALQEYYERAACLLLSGQDEQYRQAVADLEAMADASGTAADYYAAARASAISPASPVDPDKAVAWAQEAADADPQPWRFHVLATALFRADELDRATKLLEQINSQFGWGRELNDIVLCLIQISRGDFETARKYRNQVHAWIETTESSRAAGGGRSQCTNWVELQVLLKEADANLQRK